MMCLSNIFFIWLITGNLGSPVRRNRQVNGGDNISALEIDNVETMIDTWLDDQFTILEGEDYLPFRDDENNWGYEDENEVEEISDRLSEWEKLGYYADDVTTLDLLPDNFPPIYEMQVKQFGSPIYFDEEEENFYPISVTFILAAILIFIAIIGNLIEKRKARIPRRSPPTSDESDLGDISTDEHISSVSKIVDDSPPSYNEIRMGDPPSYSNLEIPQ